MDERTARLALSLVPGIGSGRLHTLVRAFGNSALAAWRARSMWSEKVGVTPKIVAAAAALRAGRIDEERRRLDALQARIVIPTDAEYPAGLHDVAAPAPVLFVRGRLPTDYRTCIAVVGSRRPSASGERTSVELASHLAAVGVGIVSGLALGVDGAAHRGALNVEGTTVAVLGCGLDYAYPRVHAHLMETIAHTGAVVTEYTLGTKPLPRHFPARNRLIAGLSAGVVLVESGRTGGALHTVEYALAAGREVMAVPGDVHRWQSEAPNELIKDGALLVRNAADVLRALGRTSWPPEAVRGETAAAATAPPSGKGDGAVADRLLAQLAEDGAMTADELVTTLRVSAADVAAALTWLEVIGRVGRKPGGRFDALR